MTETTPKPDEENPACPACGAVMSLERTLPSLGGLPELKTFKCEACGEVEVVETSDLHKGAQQVYAQPRRAASA